MRSRASTSGSSPKGDGRRRTRGPRRRGIEPRPRDPATTAWMVPGLGPSRGRTVRGSRSAANFGTSGAAPRTVCRSLVPCPVSALTARCIERPVPLCTGVVTGLVVVLVPAVTVSRGRPVLRQAAVGIFRRLCPALRMHGCGRFGLERLRRRPCSMSQRATFTCTGEPFAPSVGSGLRGVALESPGQPMAPGGQRRTPPRYGICAPRRLGNISTRERPGGNVGGRLGAGLGRWERSRGLACAVHHRPTPVSNAHGRVHAKRLIRWFTTAWGRPAPPCRTPRGRTVVLVPGEPAHVAAASESSGRSPLKMNLCPSPALCPPSPTAMGALRTPARAYGSCIEAGVSSHASPGTPALGAARSLWLVATCTCGAGPFISQNSLVMALYRTFRTVRRRRSIPPQLRCPRARVRSCRYGDADRDDQPARVEFRFHRVP